MYNDTITLFNWHEATERWYPTVFTRADVGEITSSNSTAQAGKTGNDTVSIIIHCDADKSFTATDGTVKSYLRAKEYALCNDPAAHITFKPERDFVYAGEWNDPQPVSDDDYEAGFYHEMNDTHDDVYMISSAAFFSLLPHFEIGGR